MPLSAGTRLGHYDVTALIGEGGMGQVYQATDTKLNRQVALKILPEAVTDVQGHSCDGATDADQSRLYGVHPQIRERVGARRTAVAVPEPLEGLLELLPLPGLVPPPELFDVRAEEQLVQLEERGRILGRRQTQVKHGATIAC